VRDFIGVFAVYALERQARESFGGGLI
jgi:hypothetical protein